MEPAMDFAKEAEAAGAYGENVRKPGELKAALARCLSRVRGGQSAVLAAWLPRIGEKP
jgi:acetolactate synthase-1/2/3 large subunit